MYISNLGKEEYRVPTLLPQHRSAETVPASMVVQKVQRSTVHVEGKFEATCNETNKGKELSSFQSPSKMADSEVLTNTIKVKMVATSLISHLTFGLPSNLGTFDLKIDDTAGALFILLPSYCPGPGPLTCGDQTDHVQ